MSDSERQKTASRGREIFPSGKILVTTKQVRYIKWQECITQPRAIEVVLAVMLYTSARREVTRKNKKYARASKRVTPISIR